VARHDASEDGGGGFFRLLHVDEYLTVDARGSIRDPRAQVQQVPQHPGDLGSEQVNGGRVALVRRQRDHDDTGRVNEGDDRDRHEPATEGEVARAMTRYFPLQVGVDRPADGEHVDEVIGDTADRDDVGRDPRRQQVDPDANEVRSPLGGSAR